MNVVARGIPIVIVGQIAPRDTVLATYRRVLAHLPTPLARAARLGAALGMPPGRPWVNPDD